MIASDNLTAQQKELLARWFNNYSGYGPYSPFEGCLSYRMISEFTGTDLKVLKKMVPELRKLGYVEFHRGLLDDDGQVAGSGHCLSYDKQKEIAKFVAEYLEDDNEVADQIGELLTEKEDVFRRSLGSPGYHNSFGSGYDQGIVEGLRLALEIARGKNDD